MIKWLTKITISREESQSFYHYHDNRVLPSMVDQERADKEGWWRKPEYIINDLNLNSAITHPVRLCVCACLCLYDGNTHTRMRLILLLPSLTNRPTTRRSRSTTAPTSSRATPTAVAAGKCNAWRSPSTTARYVGLA